MWGIVSHTIFTKFMVFILVPALFSTIIANGLSSAMKKTSGFVVFLSVMGVIMSVTFTWYCLACYLTGGKI